MPCMLTLIGRHSNDVQQFRLYKEVFSKRSQCSSHAATVPLPICWLVSDLLWIQPEPQQVN